MLKRARGVRKAAQKKVVQRVSKRKEQLHEKRVLVTHKIRGERKDGLLGKTELEARLLYAVRYDMFQVAKAIKERLTAIKDAKAALGSAKSAQDFDAAEAAEATLSQLRQREPFESELAALFATWAETHPERAARIRAKEDAARSKSDAPSGSGSGSGSGSESGSDDGGDSPSLMAEWGHKLHSRKVTMVHRLRGKRKDGGLGKTELEAMAYDAEAKGHYAEAALLLSRCRALHDAKMAKKQAIAEENFAEAQAQNKLIAELREREPFMRQIAEARAAADAEAAAQAAEDANSDAADAAAHGSDAADGPDAAGVAAVPAAAGSGAADKSGAAKQSRLPLDGSFFESTTFESHARANPVIVTQLTQVQTAGGGRYALGPGGVPMPVQGGSGVGAGAGASSAGTAPGASSGLASSPASASSGVIQPGGIGGPKLASPFEFDSDSSYETLELDLAL